VLKQKRAKLQAIKQGTSRLGKNEIHQYSALLVKSSLRQKGAVRYTHLLLIGLELVPTTLKQMWCQQKSCKGRNF